MTTREINAAGLALIKTDESCVLTAYRDIKGVLTIGWGHTAGVFQGQTITQAQADAFLAADLAWAEAFVQQHVTVPLTDNQFAALVSLTFNIGPVAFQESTLLRLLNAKQYASVPAQLARWNMSGGQVSRGLTRRRAEEATLWGTA